MANRLAAASGLASKVHSLRVAMRILSATFRVSITSPTQLSSSANKNRSAIRRTFMIPMKKMALVVFAALALHGVSFAQVAGRLSGSVADTSGAVIAGATVE